jgi:2-polyprenyl-3-methyl-5-hydroxy-6-metoxy-1,4-benzoquinol methylase
MSSERQKNNHDNPWWGEHLHRYIEALKYCSANDKILDLACGTGFGTDLLAAATTNTVIGGDIADIAITECNIQWQRPNLKFHVIDGTKLPFNNSSFDVVVSFETIEHTVSYNKMLEEFSRILKPGGIAIISTPNFTINSPTGKIINPFHTQEFTYFELNLILASIFSDVSIHGQKFSRSAYGILRFADNLFAFIFNLKGVRKFIPNAIKNKLSLLFTGRPFYPTSSDFSLVANKSDVLLCKTFFCICRK